MATQNIVPKLYTGVVDDVINNVREAFLDEGVDDQVLQELKQLWSTKLQQSKAVEVPGEKKESMGGVYAQQHQLIQQEQARQQQQRQQQQQQMVVQPAAVARAQAPQVQPAPQAQLPVFHPATGTLEMSGAAQAATRALPQQSLLQQQIAALQGQLQPGQSIAINQGGNQYILQSTPQGQHILLQTQQAPPANITLAAAQPTQDPQQQQATQQGLIQLDGANDSSSDDDDDDDDDDERDLDDDENENEAGEEVGEEEEPLNSNDDVSEDDDPQDVFDTDNVVVCQFDKINRAKNKWKFHLKDGIMNLNGKDYVFQKGTGEADW